MKPDYSRLLTREQISEILSKAYEKSIENHQSIPTIKEIRKLLKEEDFLIDNELVTGNQVEKSITHHFKQLRADPKYKNIKYVFHIALIDLGIATEDEINKKGPRRNERNGTAAEYYVMAELLFKGYTPSKLLYDEGLDIFAVRDGRGYYIQVKHVSLSNGKLHVDSINFMDNSSFNPAFLFMVLKYFKGKKEVKELYIFTKNDLYNFVGRTRTANYHFKIFQRNGETYLKHDTRVEENIEKYKDSWEVLNLS